MTADELTTQAQMAFEQALPDDASPYEVGKAWVAVGEHLAACLAEAFLSRLAIAPKP